MQRLGDGCKSSCADMNTTAGIGVASATGTCSLVVINGRDAEAGLWQHSLCFLTQAPIGCVLRRPQCQPEVTYFPYNAYLGLLC